MNIHCQRLLPHSLRRFCSIIFFKTFLRKTLTPHCGPTLTTLPKDVFIFQQSLQLSFKINAGEKILKYFEIASSLWPHHIPGVNDLNKPQSYLQTSNSIHMYIFICKIATPNCGPFNSTIGDHDLNNFKFAQPKDAFTQVHKLMLLKPICFWKKHFKLLFVYYKIWHPHPHPSLPKNALYKKGGRTYWSRTTSNQESSLELSTIVS